jgi:hypothetical protein
MTIDSVQTTALYDAQFGESAIRRSTHPPSSEGDDASAGPVDGPYGPPPIVPRESNYISDENLLAWLAMKQDGLYSDLRDHMDMSKARSKLMEDLNHLKGQIDAGGMSREEATAEINRLLQAYEGTEFEGPLNELFAQPLGELAAVPGRAQDRMPDLPDLPLMDEDDYEIEMPAAMATAMEDALAQEVLKPLSSAIENKVDALGRDDQLELIEIQSLTADLREVAQLASNLIASSNQAANSIVGNIAR